MFLVCLGIYTQRSTPLKKKTLVLLLFILFIFHSFDKASHTIEVYAQDNSVYEDSTIRIMIPQNWENEAFLEGQTYFIYNDIPIPFDGRYESQQAGLTLIVVDGSVSDGQQNVFGLFRDRVTPDFLLGYYMSAFIFLNPSINEENINIDENFSMDISTIYSNHEGFTFAFDDARYIAYVVPVSEQIAFMIFAGAHEDSWEIYYDDFQAIIESLEYLGDTVERD